MIGILAAAHPHLVRFDFSSGLARSLSMQSVIAVLIGGAINGYVLGVGATVLRIRLRALVFATFGGTLLVGLELFSVIGQSIAAPNNTAAYLGSHTGFVALSILYGTAAGIGFHARRGTRPLPPPTIERRINPWP